jgi:hypothetical protein
MRDVHESVGVEGDMNVVELGREAHNHGGESLHVLIGTRYEQGPFGVAEVVLWVNDDQVNLHSLLLPF